MPPKDGSSSSSRSVSFFIIILFIFLWEGVDESSYQTCEQSLSVCLTYILLRVHFEDEDIHILFIICALIYMRHATFCSAISICGN